MMEPLKDVLSSRLELATKLGADHVIDLKKGRSRLASLLRACSWIFDFDDSLKAFEDIRNNKALHCKVLIRINA
jgi:threonine dehydrogenase-like Zn-dependent dehydrogenase